MDIILAVMSRVHYTMVSGSIEGGAIAAAASPTLAADGRVRGGGSCDNLYQTSV